MTTVSYIHTYIHATLRNHLPGLSLPRTIIDYISYHFVPTLARAVANVRVLGILRGLFGTATLAVGVRLPEVDGDEREQGHGYKTDVWHTYTRHIYRFSACLQDHRIASLRSIAYYHLARFFTHHSPHIHPSIHTPNHVPQINMRNLPYVSPPPIPSYPH